MFYSLIVMVYRFDWQGYSRALDVVGMCSLVKCKHVTKAK